jgi:hypothetical protein
MSKILVIEPYRILQQGIAISLYPENDVQLMDGVPENLNSNDFDAAIVDAASLQESNALDAAVLRSIQGWKIPTIWIEGDISGRVPTRGKVVTLQRPLGRQALMAALRECLGAASGEKRNAALADRNDDRRVPSKRTAREETSADTAAAEIIELTEVVEQTGAGKGSSQQKNK